MGVDYAKGFLEVPILDKTHYFTLKCSHIIFADLQYWKRNLSHTTIQLIIGHIKAFKSHMLLQLQKSTIETSHVNFKMVLAWLVLAHIIKESLSA